MSDSRSNKANSAQNIENVIINYLDDTLTPKEKAKFEQRMRRDSRLSESVRLQRKIKYAFEHPHLKDDIALIESAQRAVESEKTFVFSPTILSLVAFIVLIVAAALIFT